MPVGEGISLSSISNLLNQGVQLASALVNTGGNVQQTNTEALRELARQLGLGDSPVDVPGVDFAAQGSVCAAPAPRTVGNAYPAMAQKTVMTEAGTTRVITYRNMGAPVLYAGDLAAVARVRNVAKRVNRACPTGRRGR